MWNNLWGKCLQSRKVKELMKALRKSRGPALSGFCLFSSLMAINIPVLQREEEEVLFVLMTGKKVVCERSCVFIFDVHRYSY